VHELLYNAANYLLSLLNYFSVIIVLVCVALIYRYQFIITRFTQYHHKSSYTYKLQAHISRRSVIRIPTYHGDYRAGIRTHYVHQNSFVQLFREKSFREMSVREIIIRETSCSGSVHPENVFSGPGNVRL